MLDILKARIADPIARFLSIRPTFVFPLFSAAIGYTTTNDYTVHNREHDSSDDETIVRRLWGGHIALGGSHIRSLYYNALLFVRVNLPFGIFFGVRWSGRTDHKAFLHVGLGWKLNGTFAMTFRIQSDETAARGTNGPNVGQAIGWEGGPK